jgi:hypothetical protein
MKQNGGSYSNGQTIIASPDLGSAIGQVTPTQNSYVEVLAPSTLYCDLIW